MGVILNVIVENKEITAFVALAILLLVLIVVRGDDDDRSL